MKDTLNIEISVSTFLSPPQSSNEINGKMNKELEDHMFAVSLNHTKVVKFNEEDRDKQVAEINYALADVRENIETEAVEK